MPCMHESIHHHANPVLDKAVCLLFVRYYPIYRIVIDHYFTLTYNPNQDVQILLVLLLIDSYIFAASSDNNSS